MNSTLKYLSNINFQNVRAFILNNKLGDGDTLGFSNEDFNSLLEEYRIMYNLGMPTPYFILGVEIEEDLTVPISRLKIVKGAKEE